MKKGDAVEYSLWLHRDFERYYDDNSLNQIARSKSLSEMIVRDFIDKPLPPSDTKNYERIHVFHSGVFPDFTPDSPNQPVNTMFADDTFQDLMAIGEVRQNVVYQTTFDEKKFLAIANTAVAWFERTLPLEIEIHTQDVVSEEFVIVDVHIQATSSQASSALQFYVDDSEVQATSISGGFTGRIARKQRYRIGIPTGKHRIQVAMKNSDGQSVAAWQSVLSTFASKPTLHLVAIGINEFPNLGSKATLIGAVNDAALIQGIFRNNASDLFGGRLSISPYSLSPAQTTKDNITKLIESVKAKVRPNDYFVLFVSSHGLIHDKKYYFAPSDIDFAPDARAFSGNEKSKVINGFGEDQLSSYLINIPTIFRMAILDTCHAGREVDGISQLLATLPLGEQAGISILAAAKSTQAAADNYKGNGLFTHVLANGLLGGADYNRDNIIDSIEIAEYVRSHVGEVARNHAGRAQDAVVLPDPRIHFSRRFELTRVLPEPSYKLQPSVFTPRESQLYVNAIAQDDSSLMTGVILNNQRLNRTSSRPSLADVPSAEVLANLLSRYGSVDISILFATASSAPAPQEMDKIRKLAAALNSAGLSGKRVFIEGHADGTGDNNYNLGLSQQRADQVLTILHQSFGVEGRRLQALGFGELYPVASNDTENGRRQNRRVSVFVYNES